MGLTIHQIRYTTNLRIITDTRHHGPRSDHSQLLPLLAAGAPTVPLVRVSERFQKDIAILFGVGSCSAECTVCHEPLRSVRTIGTVRPHFCELDQRIRDDPRAPAGDLSCCHKWKLQCCFPCIVAPSFVIVFRWRRCLMLCN